MLALYKLMPHVASVFVYFNMGEREGGIAHNNWLACFVFYRCVNTRREGGREGGRGGRERVREGGRGKPFGLKGGGWLGGGREENKREEGR